MMLEVTIKLVGEPGSGKSVFARNLASFLKACPYDLRVQVWSKQPTSPTWTRELLVSTIDGLQVTSTAEATTDREPI